MGIWNAHTSVGNILGSLICSAMLSHGWGWAFLIPGITMAFGGLIIFFFLVVDPVIVGFPPAHEATTTEGSSKGRDHEAAVNPDTTGYHSKSDEPLLNGSEASDSGEHNAVSFLKAWAIPGVAPFALCLFFTKLVAYTFLYWLPYYISHTGTKKGLLWIYLCG